jgi:hypothetical protein
MAEIPLRADDTIEGAIMSTIITQDGTQIYYKDWGKGQPMFFHNGWPLSAADWDAQMMFFLGLGYPRTWSVHADGERTRHGHLRSGRCASRGDP